MKEELTTEMHSEFAVSDKTDMKHKVWSLLSESTRLDVNPVDLLDIYRLSEDELNKHKQSYFDLSIPEPLSSIKNI